MPFSSLVLRSGALAFTSISLFAHCVSGVTSSTYALSVTYSGSSFFDGFDFFTGPDPTNGFVNYVDQTTAQSKNLISSGNGVAAYMGVDYSTTLNASAPIGRSSVRISSKASFTHGLIISDIAHMPGGICGTWPAHWTLGPNWPTNGEIDIIEGVNDANENLMSLHTSPGCTIAGSGESGTLQTNNCDTSLNFNSGCGVTSTSTSSYGTGFNSGNGGVYATQWTSDYIRIWFFPRGSVPADITAGTPNPALWGLPAANFQGSCTIDSKFANHNIIFDTTFCGDYAGTVWSQSPTCSALASTCNAYVASHPSAFQNAYWSINSVKVYQLVGTPSTPSSSTTLTSAVPQSSVFGPGMGTNSSTRTTAPAAAATQAANLASVGTFTFLGCASSSSSFSTFTQVDNSINMSVDRCTSECANFNYAGIFNSFCYCGNTLDSSTSFNSNSGPNTCTNPCPGNPAQLCGGSSSPQPRARQLSPSILLSLYQNTGGTNGVHFGGVSVNINVLVSVAPAFAVFGYGMGGGASTRAVITTTYLDTCPTCPNGLTAIALTTTLPHCGCVGGMPSLAPPALPMATVTKACSACAGGTVAVTVPYAVAYTPPPAAAVTYTAPKPPSNATASVVLFLGAASRGEVGAGWVMGIMAALVLVAAGWL